MLIKIRINEAYEIELYDENMNSAEADLFIVKFISNLFVNNGGKIFSITVTKE